MSERLERHRVYVVSVLVLVIAMGGLLLWIRRPQPEPIIISTPEPTATTTSVPTPTLAPLRVYVTGAVRKPDVYVLPPGSIVKDAVSAAGGATADADLDRINLALEVYDQQQVYVPSKGEGTPPVALPAAATPPVTKSLLTPSSTQKVNINSASVEELDTLPGVGPAIAQRIVDYRTEHGPFATVEDIMNVKGIGPSTFAKLRDMITTQ